MTQRVEYMPEGEIEAVAEGVLTEFEECFGTMNSTWVPVEDIAEGLMGLNVEYDDLEQMLGCGDVMAATFVEGQSVFIDQSLDPTQHP